MAPLPPRSPMGTAASRDGGASAHGRGRDEVLDAFAEVAALLETLQELAARVTARVAEVQRGRAEGSSYRDLLSTDHGPLVVEALTRLLAEVGETGSRLRRAKARALYAEGLSMEKIGLLLGVSRQRVAALLNGPHVGRRAPHSVPPGRASQLPLTKADVRLIADAVPHMVWVTGATGTTEYLNATGSRYTGLPPDTDLAWHAPFLVHPEDRKRASGTWWEAIRTEADLAIEYRARRADGAYRLHAFRSVALRAPDGTVKKWFCTATDIHPWLPGP